MDRFLDGATSWGISRRSAAVLMLVPVVGLFVLVAMRLRVGLYDFVLDEDGPVEWLQFAAYTACVPVAAMAAVRLRARGDLLIAAAYAFVACAALFIAGEEISWGQRAFGVATPEALAEV